MTEQTGKRRGLVLLLLTAACALAAVLVAERFHFRLDLSADRSMSLSKAALGLGEGIPERVRLSYYISPLLSARHPGPRAVEDLLREVEAASRGKIAVAVIDPATAGGAADSLGLSAQRMQVVEKNEQRVALVYSGIAIEYLGRLETLPFVLDTATLEYDLVKAVRRAVSASSPEAAVIVGDGDKSFSTDYQGVKQALEAARWQVTELAPGDPVPPSAGVLLVLGNNAIDDYAAYRVDEYLARGGALLLALKGVDVAARQSLTAAPLGQDALLRALAAWGASLGRSLVLDRSSLTVPFQDSASGSLALRYVRYPHWVVVRPENVDKGNPVTAGFSGLDLFWPSPITLAPPAGVEAKGIVKSSGQAWLMTKDFAVGSEEEYRFTAEQEGTTGSYVLAATLAGTFPMAYAGKPLPGREGSGELPPLPSQARPGKILLVGSADFATDLMGMTDSGFNAAFIANAVEWLASGDELAAIKARGGRDPRLTKVQEPGARSFAILAAYAVNLVLVPGGLVLAGLLRAGRRRRLAGAAQAATAAAPAVPAGTAAEGEQR